MIVSIGIDLVRIDRLQSIATRWDDRFLARVYTQAERDACFARAIPFSALAGRFALKEAMFKALGTGWGAGVRWVEVEVYTDGLAAWEAIEREGGAPIDAIVSDIEMPRMDGLHLTKLIKESPRHKDIPVVLFSSLISEDNANKGVQVGANVQIPKPELPEMVRLVDRIVSGKSVDHTILGEIAVQAAA